MKILSENTEHLDSLISNEIAVNGHNCSLNHIDVSKITDMKTLFYNSPFTGDISQWDTSSVTDMTCMFFRASFNGDISQWNTSNVKNMSQCFAFSKFNCDISSWDVSNVTSMQALFFNCDFQYDLSIWKPYLLENSFNIFNGCQAPKPYWINYIDNLKSAIDSYVLYQKLNNNAVNLNNSKKIKI